MSTILTVLTLIGIGFLAFGKWRAALLFMALPLFAGLGLVWIIYANSVEWKVAGPPVSSFTCPDPKAWDSKYPLVDDEWQRPLIEWRKTHCPTID